MCSWSLQPKDPEELVQALTGLGIKKTQLAVTPMVDCPDTWADAAKTLRDAGIQIVSGMFAPIGEDYRTLDTIRATGGIVPDQHWEANVMLARDVAAIAQRENINTITFHAGFVPHDTTDPDYAKLRDRLTTLAGLYADAGCDLLLETGQETADDLLAFLQAADQPNVGVNFDPANMILYGKGDPIQAVRQLIAHVKQVHIKDANAATTPGQWGAEVPAGTGQVNWPGFFKVLQDAGYSGHLVIEREAGDNRIADIATARDMVMGTVATG